MAFGSFRFLHEESKACREGGPLGKEGGERRGRSDFLMSHQPWTRREKGIEYCPKVLFLCFLLTPEFTNHLGPQWSPYGSNHGSPETTSRDQSRCMHKYTTLKADPMVNLHEKRMNHSFWMAVSQLITRNGMPRIPPNPMAITIKHPGSWFESCRPHEKISEIYLFSHYTDNFSRDSCFFLRMHC